MSLPYQRTDAVKAYLNGVEVPPEEMEGAREAMLSEEEIDRKGPRGLRVNTTMVRAVERLFHLEEDYRKDEPKLALEALKEVRQYVALAAKIKAGGSMKKAAKTLTLLERRQRMAERHNAVALPAPAAEESDDEEKDEDDGD